MRKEVVLFFIVLVVSSAFVFAAGSGGGGRIIKKVEIEQPKTVQAEQKPVEAEDLSKELKCGDLAAREERVRCRLNLKEGEYARENELLYLPEECRDLTGERKNNCINLYKKTQRCWKFPVGESRLGCVREDLNLGRSLSTEIKTCDGKGAERSQCISDVREKVFNLVKFRFYDLEERAEKFLEEGRVSEDDVVSLVAKLEEKKVEFNNAATTAQKKAIIMEIRQIWKEFIGKVRR